MKISLLLSLALAALLSAGCKAPSPRTCNDHYAGGQAPVITSDNLSKHTTVLCFEEYALAFSGVSRTPLWSAQHLTREHVEQAKGMKRKTTFHAEDKLPAGDRSELTDYARSGYDRGHMAPSGDMPTETAQHESFSLANMIPQNPNNNQMLWAAIEEATRNLAEKDGQLYVVTGPIFEGSALQRVNGRILVPTSVYKAIYDQAQHAAGAYVAANAPGMEYRTLSIAELEQRIKINVFPGVAPEIKASKMPLPVPAPHSQRGRRPVEVQ